MAVLTPGPPSLPPPRLPPKSSSTSHSDLSSQLCTPPCPASAGPFGLYEPAAPHHNTSNASAPSAPLQCSRPQEPGCGEKGSPLWPQLLHTAPSGPQLLGVPASQSCCPPRALSPTLGGVRAADTNPPLPALPGLSGTPAAIFQGPAALVLLSTAQRLAKATPSPHPRLAPRPPLSQDGRLYPLCSFTPWATPGCLPPHCLASACLLFLFSLVLLIFMTHNHCTYA